METMIFPLKRPRGKIENVVVDFEQVDDSETIGHDFRAWISLAGNVVEFQQGGFGSSKIDTYYPFEGHDTYHVAGELVHRDAIKSIYDWIAWLQEYATDIDPRDIFRYRRLEGL